MNFGFADLFCGAGGFGLGFREAGFEEILGVDWWEAARECQLANYPATPFDIADLFQPAEVERVGNLLKGCAPDLIIGGPPCQGFSTLGKGDPADRRNGLVFAFLGLVAVARPRAFIMENVKTMATTTVAPGRRVSDLVGEFFFGHQVGYRIFQRVLRGTDYGMAQTRERVFFFGVRDDIEADDVTLDALLAQHRRPGGVLADVIGDLPELRAGGGAERMTHDGRVILNHRALAHGPELIARFKHIPPGGGLPDVPRDLLTPHLRRMRDGEYGPGGGIKNIYGRMEWDKPSGTIVAGIDKITCGRFVHPRDHRLLSVRECARIQSFPDEFCFVGGLVTQYYLVGNAVPPAFSRIWASVVAKMFDEHAAVRPARSRSMVPTQIPLPLLSLQSA